MGDKYAIDVRVPNSGKTALHNRAFADDHGTVYHGTGGHPVFLVYNGEKLPGPIAFADLALWTRDSPHPYFAPIRPLAGLMALAFHGGGTAHLAIIDTPSRPQTMIADLGTPWDDEFPSWGTWWFSDGTAVGVGTADDLVVTGVISYTSGNLFVRGYADLLPRIATPPFADDPTPLAIHIVGEGVRLGSFYSAAGSPFGLRPVRSFTAVDSGLGYGLAHLAVLHTGGDTYLVFACSTDPAGLFSQYCSISATGGFARYGTRAWYQMFGTSIDSICHDDPVRIVNLIGHGRWERAETGPPRSRFYARAGLGGHTRDI